MTPFLAIFGWIGRLLGGWKGIALAGAVSAILGVFWAGFHYGKLDSAREGEIATRIAVESALKQAAVETRRVVRRNRELEEIIKQFEEVDDEECAELASKPLPSCEFSRVQRAIDQISAGP